MFDDKDSGVLAEWQVEEYLRSLVPDMPPLEGMEVGLCLQGDV